MFGLTSILSLKMLLARRNNIHYHKLGSLLSVPWIVATSHLPPFQYCVQPCCLMWPTLESDLIEFYLLLCEQWPATYGLKLTVALLKKGSDNPSVDHSCSTWWNPLSGLAYHGRPDFHWQLQLLFLAGEKLLWPIAKLSKEGKESG